MSTELTKDQSIVLQVAAKIASDLTISTPQTSVDQRVADWASALQTVYSVMAEMHGWEQVTAPAPVERAVALVQQAFPNAEVVPMPAAAPAPAPQQATVRVKGTQHGPLPDWLPAACAAAGVTEVWDNRDGLAQNPKRPHFKQVNGDAAFWPPRGRAA